MKIKLIFVNPSFPFVLLFNYINAILRQDGNKSNTIWLSSCCNSWVFSLKG